MRRFAVVVLSLCVLLVAVPLASAAQPPPVSYVVWTPCGSMHAYAGPQRHAADEPHDPEQPPKPDDSSHHPNDTKPPAEPPHDDRPLVQSGGSINFWGCAVPASAGGPPVLFGQRVGVLDFCATILVVGWPELQTTAPCPAPP